jgi:hypothetical protein
VGPTFALAVAVRVEYCVGQRNVELADRLTDHEPPPAIEYLDWPFDTIGALVALEEVADAVGVVFREDPEDPDEPLELAACAMPRELDNNTPTTNTFKDANFNSFITSSMLIQH